ncbi:MAG: MBL fold metallo-hydrolase [Thermoplasmataceae archaeon]
MWESGLIELKDGIYGYVQQGGSWFIGNCGLIIGKEYNIVVDSLSNEPMIKPFLDAMKKVTDRPARYLVNTHLHADHVWTNHYFMDAVAIAHENCRASVIEEEKHGVKELFSKLMTTMDFSSSEFTPQKMTFSDRLTLFQDSMEVRLIHQPNAHTVSDVIVHLPDEKIVYTGDLLFAAPCTPFAMMGSLTGYIEALDYLKSLNAEVYVPGHGPLSYGTEALEVAKKYLKFVQDSARKLYDDGITDYLKAALEVDLGEYGEWSDKERIIGNMARAYSEIRGEPRGVPLPDTNGIFELMLSHRGTLSSAGKK